VGYIVRPCLNKQTNKQRAIYNIPKDKAKQRFATQREIVIIILHWGCSSSMGEALGLIPNATKKKITNFY
jgi:hypothetical protein